MFFRFVILSMGAVFAIFSGVYFWFWKITGREVISEEMASMHFWTTFVGVNLTFFPMHFLGLNGMPRRVPDYPDAFAPLNYIASVGSMISLVAAIFFLAFMYVSLVTPRQFLTIKTAIEPLIIKTNHKKVLSQAILAGEDGPAFTLKKFKRFKISKNFF
jgi:heme/copper-type cytochrome/quinol oxidase subunit 1